MRLGSEYRANRPHLDFLTTLRRHYEATLANEPPDMVQGASSSSSVGAASKSDLRADERQLSATAFWEAVELASHVGFEVMRVWCRHLQYISVCLLWQMRPHLLDNTAFFGALNWAPNHVSPIGVSTHG